MDGVICRWQHAPILASQPAMQPPPDPSGLPPPAMIDAVSLHAGTDSSFILNRPLSDRWCHLQVAASPHTHLPQPAMWPPAGCHTIPRDELRRRASCRPRSKSCWRVWSKGGTHRVQLDPVHKGALAWLRLVVPACSKPHFSPCSALLCTQAEFVSTCSMNDLTAHAQDL